MNRSSLVGCIGMDFKAKPLHMQIELQLKLLDKSLADVAEGSDVV
ncbi:MAG: hypothetical protein PHV74_08735 [Dehalococcoidia bacterium]|nr:hypothetical protein [Dehalococcoidia bacterium]